MFGLIVIVACVICGMLGLTAGVNLNPSATVRYVWDWNAAGSWVSGVGALLAVSVALWQSSLQQSKDRIRTLLVNTSSPTHWRVRLVCEGLIPVTVLGAELRLNSVVLGLSQFFKNQPGFSTPAKLERGDVQQIIDIDQSNFDSFAEFLVRPAVRRVRDKGLRERDMNYGVNEEFFSAIDLYRTKEATLILRLAHDDLVIPVPSSLLDRIFIPAMQHLRQAAEEDAQRQVAKDRELYADLSKSVRP
jgi:hypothetical protein